MIFMVYLGVWLVTFRLFCERPETHCICSGFWFKLD